MIKVLKHAFVALVAISSFQTQAQCVVDAGPDTVYASCGSNVNLSAVGLSDIPVLSTNFDGGQIGAGWSTSGIVLYNNPCGPSLDGTPSAWFGNVPLPRTLTTAGFDMSCGGQVCFDLDFAGDDVPGSDCEDPDLIDEGVFFQYSINGGATWIDIFYFQPDANYGNAYYAWANYCFVLPAAAWTTNTMFQWTQPNASSTANDHWGLDNVEIVPINCGYYYDWNNIPGSPDNASQTVSPIGTSTYVVTYTDGLLACDDTVTIIVPTVLAQATSVLSNLVCGNCTNLNIAFTNYNVGSIIDDFDPAPDGTMWTSTTGGLLGSVGLCGSVSGNALYFKNTGARAAVTTDVNTTAGCGFLSFSMFVGNVGSGPNCENADAGENILLQYSTNGGGTWTTLNTYLESSWDANNNWQNFFVPIPPLAQTLSTRFRWTQPVFTNTVGQDAWALDNVSFTCSPPAFDVLWSPASTLNDPTLQLTNACPIDTTTYTATITDPQTGCSATSSVTVNASCPCTIAGINAVIGSCEPGNTFSVSGDFIYVENPGTGTLVVEVTNASGTYTQTIPGPFTDQLLTNFSVSGIPADGSPLVVSIYFSDELTCIATLNDVSPGQPEVVSTSGSGVYCFGDPIGNVEAEVIGVGPFTISYTFDGVLQTATSPVSPVILGNLPGDYQLISISDATCDNTANFLETILEKGVPEMLSIENGGVYCAGEVVEQVFAVVQGVSPFDLNYTLDGVPQVVSSVNDTIYLGNASGSYVAVLVTDVACSNDALGNQSIVINPLPIIDAGADYVVCDGESITLNATGAQNYIWDNGLPNGSTFVPTTTATYNVVGEDANGCFGQDAITITVEPIPTPSFVADQLNGCEPMNVVFANTTIGNFSNCYWNFGDGNSTTDCSDVQNTYENGGTYDVTLTVTTINGCTNTITYDDYIYVENTPSASFVPSLYTVISLDTEVSFDNTSTGAVSYVWDFGDESPTVDDINPTHEFPDNQTSSYFVTLYAFSPLGCVDSFNVVIQVNEEVIYYIPNTFTPDGDEFNQTFQPIFTAGFDAYDWNMKIFNRWGQIIFESNDPTEGWDGTIDGLMVQDGTYVWTVEFKTNSSDERRTDTGHLNVIR